MDRATTDSPTAPLIQDQERWDLVITKLFPPLSGGALVERVRLMRSLDLPSLKRLVLIAAPAGFGKTTLMAHGYKSLAAQGVCTAWVSLDEDDRHPRRFLAYVTTALAMAGLPRDDRVAALIDSGGEGNLPFIIRRLVNLIGSQPGKVTLFLDDYHRADTPQLNEFVEAFLSLAPPNFHIVLAGRNIPNLPLASLRVHDSVTDINAQILKFDEEEARTFMADARRLNLRPDQVKVLQARTEGWIAGLQLAALALGSRRDSVPDIAAFKGDARDVADYLANEVLDALNADMRQFLLRTSVLERMNADVCNILCQCENAQSYLEELETNNIFVVPLDQNRTWYRYHHMFRDFLISQLKKSDPKAFTVLNARAAEWFENQGYMEEALDYYLQGNEGDRAAVLVEHQALRLISFGRMHDLTNWIGKLPTSVIARRPHVSLFLCWALFHTRQHQGALAAMLRAETIIQTLEATGNLPDTIERQKLWDEVEVLKSGIAIAADDQEASYTITRRLLGQTSERGHFFQAALNNIYGYACYARSDFVRARQNFERAYQIHSESGAVFGTIYSDIFLGQVDAAEGKLHNAYAQYNKARRSAAQSHQTPRNLLAAADVMRSGILYEWNQLKEAAGLLDKSLELVVDYGHPDAPFYGYVTRARIASAEGKDDLAQDALLQARAMGRDSGSDRFVLLSDLEYMRFLLMRQRIEDALRLSHEHGIALTDKRPLDASRWDRCEALRSMMRLRLASAMGEFDLALEWADYLLKLASATGRQARLLQFLVQSAIIAAQQGNRSRAIKDLATALSLSHNEGFIRTFLDEGQVLHQLLPQMLADKAALGLNADIVIHTRRLLLAFEDKYLSSSTSGSGASPGRRDHAVMLEPLSDRERDVLRLLAAGSANRVIASELRLSENTVKWHLKNIFEKLGVENRTAAVLVAQQFDIFN